MFQALEDFIKYIDSWQLEKDTKMKNLNAVIDAEVSNEKKKQKAAYEQEKSWHKALYDELPGPKGKFVNDRFKLDQKPIDAITEKFKPRKKKIDETFLSGSTAKGLRLTCRSTIELTKHLLKDCGFEYVLTRKLNQDWLEV